uniref:BHLH domain-containing protein n=1 Tax=Ascaris lumbricoides TaxID=6252 RepID=A0A9J2PB54_ASCLU
MESNYTQGSAYSSMLRIDVDLSDHEQDERGTNKKANKPLMEKRRRARINRCLYEMKQMLVDGIKSGSPGQSKWEKADILEMSVAYMRQLQKKVLQTSLFCFISVSDILGIVDVHRQFCSGCVEDVLPSSQFIEGFSECLKEMQKFNANANLSSEVQQHNAKLNGYITAHLHSLTQDSRAKLSGTLEVNAVQETTAAADSEYSPTHSQTSPSSSSSAATSPKSSPCDHEEPPTRHSTKRRRKNAEFEQEVAVPLRSTLSLPYPQPSRINENSVLVMDPRATRVLPFGVDQCLLTQFLSCVRPLGMKHPQAQPSWPSAAELATACNDMNTFNNGWMHNLWRPF